MYSIFHIVSLSTSFKFHNTFNTTYTHTYTTNTHTHTHTHFQQHASFNVFVTSFRDFLTFSLVRTTDGCNNDTLTSPWGYNGVDDYDAAFNAAFSVEEPLQCGFQPLQCGFQHNALYFSFTCVLFPKAAQAMLVVTRLARGVSVGGQSPGCHVLAISTAPKADRSDLSFFFICGT